MACCVGLWLGLGPAYHSVSATASAPAAPAAPAAPVALVVPVAPAVSDSGGRPGHLHSRRRERTAGHLATGRARPPLGSGRSDRSRDHARWIAAHDAPVGVRRLAFGLVSPGEPVDRHALPARVARPAGCRRQRFRGAPPRPRHRRRRTAFRSTQKSLTRRGRDVPRQHAELGRRGALAERARRDFDARSVGRASGAKRRLAPQFVQVAAVPSGPGAASIQWWTQSPPSAVDCDIRHSPRPTCARQDNPAARAPLAITPLRAPPRPAERYPGRTGSSGGSPAGPARAATDRRRRRRRPGPDRPPRGSRPRACAAVGGSARAARAPPRAAARAGRGSPPPAGADGPTPRGSRRPRQRAAGTSPLPSPGRRTEGRASLRQRCGSVTMLSGSAITQGRLSRSPRMTRCWSARPASPSGFPCGDASGRPAARGCSG